MKRLLLSLALVLVSPLAFAQTINDNGETENPVVPEGAADAGQYDNGETENPVTPQIEASISTTDGSVAAYAPDEMIAVITAAGESISFGIGPAARYQDMSGNDIDASVIKEGSKVQVTAADQDGRMIASLIVLDS